LILDIDRGILASGRWMGQGQSPHRTSTVQKSPWRNIAAIVDAAGNIAAKINPSTVAR
jgi:hypothetical protein